MVNHIAEVAQMLGVEIEEIFKVTDDTYGAYQLYHRFTESNGIEISDDGVTWERAKAVVLKSLLMGDARIVKLPWKPKMEEKYYVPNIFDWNSWNSYDYYLWLDDKRDEEFYKRGLVFKTKEEAIEMSKKMLAMTKERMKIND